MFSQFHAQRVNVGPYCRYIYLIQKVSTQSTMADDQQFCLRWNDFQTNMVASFKHLRDEKSFCDVTIATEVFSI